MTDNTTEELAKLRDIVRDLLGTIDSAPPINYGDIFSGLQSAMTQFEALKNAYQATR